MSKKQWIVLISVGIIIALAVYYSFSPEESSFFPQCPFHYLTGYDCPGCGSQRAFHNLLHLRISSAFMANPFMVLAIPYVLVGLYFEYFGGKESFPEIRKIFFGKNAAIIIFVIVFIFWIGRNLV